MDRDAPLTTVSHAANSRFRLGRSSSNPAMNKLKLWLLALFGVALGANVVIFMVILPKPFALLDRTLGDRSRDPKALLESLTWKYNATGSNACGLGHPDFFDVQHLALLRLLELQRPRFKISVPKSATSATGIDHSFASVKATNGMNLVILGTPTLKPIRYDRPYEGYWDMHYFEFTPEGRFVSRRACTNW